MKVIHLLPATLLVCMICSCGGSTSAPGQPGRVAIAFDPAQFDGRAIDNPLFPLPVGFQWVLEALTEDGLERIEIEVTNQTRLIAGVVCVVVHAQEFLDGELTEDTFDWYAQDLSGNVWYMGELSTEYEDGMAVGTDGSWEAGVDGAQAGIIMLAAPAVGQHYVQESAPGVAEDEGRVLALNQTVTTPLGTFTGCIEIEDTTPLEPGVRESKFFAPGVGPVLEVDEEGTRTELVELQSGP